MRALLSGSDTKAQRFIKIAFQSNAMSSGATLWNGARVCVCARVGSDMSVR